MNLETITATGRSTLDEIYKKMNLIRIKTGVITGFHLYSDGSGQIDHNETVRSFGNLSTALMLMRSLESKGYMP